MNKKKLVWLVLLIAGAAALIYGYFLYNQEPADVRQLKADIQVSASELVAAFSADENAANTQYLDKVIDVTGNVASVSVDSSGAATVFLETGDPMSAVTCSFYKEEAASVSALTPGREVTIKGICTGKLSDVVLNRCSLIQ
jgi:hypothetical protein